MPISRRAFLQTGLAGGAALTAFGFDVRPAAAQARTLKIARTTHPCGFKWPIEAKLHRNAKIISVDPRFTRTSANADLYLQIRAGSDIAFLGGLVHYSIANGRIAWDYVKQYTAARQHRPRRRRCERAARPLEHPGRHRHGRRVRHPARLSEDAGRP